MRPAMRASLPHILIVDDDPSIREGLTLAFKGTYLVHGAATGAEACALLRCQAECADRGGGPVCMDCRVPGRGPASDHQQRAGRRSRAVEAGPADRGEGLRAAG